MLFKLDSMKAISTLLILGLFGSLARADSDLGGMLDRGKFEVEVLLSSELPNFTEEELYFIEHNVFLNKQERGLRLLLVATWQRLLAEKRVRKLTPDLREKLAIPRMHCTTGNRCSELVAVYLPLSHYLLVDVESVNKENAIWFFHELIHAVQYIYRFPLDIEILYRYAQEGSPDGIKIRQDQLVDYLRFFYEAQANWYILRLEQNAEWLDVKQNKAGKVTEQGLKIVFHMTTMTLFMNLRHAFEYLLPKIDDWSQDKTLRQRDTEFHELPILKKYHNFNPAIQVDLRFLQKFARAIEIGYFGDLVFLYQDDNGDQKIYRDLHNKFYSTFGERTSRFLKGCRHTFEVVQNGSPFINWLTLPKEDLDCSTYGESSFFKDRAAITNIFIQNENTSLFHGGTKGGGGPGLKIGPYIQPQLLVYPE